MTVAETIFEAIKARSIEYVFCVPGESFHTAMDAFYGSDNLWPHPTSLPFQTVRILNPSSSRGVHNNRHPKLPCAPKLFILN